MTNPVLNGLRAAALLAVPGLLTAGDPPRDPGSRGAAAPPGAAAPFVTVEAEGDDCTTTGRVVRLSGLPSRTDSSPELEASGRAFVELTETGQFLEWTADRAADGLTLRHCLPDAAVGGGRTATLGLLVNGERRAALTLDSKYNWLYGEAGQNGQSNDPAAGTPHVFWNETRFRIPGGVRPGDRLRLQKGSADDAEYYRIDCFDVEAIPAPLAAPVGALSVTDFGADGGDDQDDTVALFFCAAAAKERGAVLWLPPGTYIQSEKITLDGVALRGAGMWHTTLRCDVDESDRGWAGRFGFLLKGDGAAVADLYLTAPRHDRRSTPGGRAFTAAFDDCRNWRVEHVWIQNAHVGFWLSGVRDGALRGCRVRCTYADGINLNRGSTDNLVEQNHVRGVGDDGIALLSEIERTPHPAARNVVRHNTVIAPWWGHNLDLAGGDGQVMEDNLAADNPLFGGVTINLPGAYPMYPLRDSVIARNRIVRGGGNAFGQRRGALWIFTGAAVAEDVLIQENVILDPLFRGVHLVGDRRQDLRFVRNVIENPGQDGFVIGGGVTGRGVFIDNVVRGLPPDGRALVAPENSSTYELEATGNSWQ